MPKTFADYALVDPFGEPSRAEQIFSDLVGGMADHIATPEARSVIDDRLREFTKTIEPEGLRHHYMAFFRQKRHALWGTPQW